MDANPTRTPLGQADKMHGDKDTTTAQHKLSIGHQEVDRIVDEVEQIFSSQPTEWLSVDSIGLMILSLNDWYEDLEELEDAVGGSFEEFLRAMPQFEVRKNEAGKAEFTVLQPDDDAPPTILTFTVRTREDLWRVLYKSPHAELRFPSNEFAIGADSKRRIDSIYNHMTAAVWNLSQHLRGQAQQGGAVPDETAAGIERTVDELNKMLDVEEPFDIVVDDPTGVSSFKPSDGVDVQEMQLSSSNIFKKLTPEQQELAIKEMNDEMEELFGSPVDTSGGPSNSTAVSGSSSNFRAEALDALQATSPQPRRDHHVDAPPAASSATEHTAPREVPPRAVASAETEHANAASALRGTIGRCADELTQAGSRPDMLDLDRSTRLAACVAECARALAALEGQGA